MELRKRIPQRGLLEVYFGKHHTSKSLFNPYLFAVSP